MAEWERKEEEERAILVGIAMDSAGVEDLSAEASLDELEELVKTAGAVTVGKVLQGREAPHPALYVGTGKAEEIKAMVQELGATLVVCDDELSPAQWNNLEQALEVKIVDRTTVILDIFASRASTSEGKIQVELAQLRYRASRLVGMRNSLSRLGGGIGTRGPGEKKLEMDRRIIRERISQLKRELTGVVKTRETNRKQRETKKIPVLALVGYTNTGKSTLLNRLTGAEVLEEDKLFATLDPTTRTLKLPRGQEVLLTDTVGFIRKLPHHLIDAFRSTLEEAKYADLILHVADASAKEVYLQMQTVYATLGDLGIQDKPVITIFNKVDRLSGEEIYKDTKAQRTVRISALTGEGIPALLEAAEEELQKMRQRIAQVIPYEAGGLLARIRQSGQLISEAYEPEGIRIEAYVPRELYGQIKALEK